MLPPPCSLPFFASWNGEIDSFGSSYGNLNWLSCGKINRIWRWIGFDNLVMMMAQLVFQLKDFPFPNWIESHSNRSTPLIASDSATAASVSRLQNPTPLLLPLPYSNSLQIWELKTIILDTERVERNWNSIASIPAAKLWSKPKSFSRSGSATPSRSKIVIKPKNLSGSGSATRSRSKIVIELKNLSGSGSATRSRSKIVIKLKNLSGSGSATAAVGWLGGCRTRSSQVPPSRRTFRKEQNAIHLNDVRFDYRLLLFLVWKCQNCRLMASDLYFRPIRL